MKVNYKLMVAFIGLFTKSVFSQTDGTLDSTFNNNGKLITNLLNVSASFQSVAVQSDGKIVCAGGVSNGFTITDYDMVVARFNSNGSPDLSFGTNGITKVDFNTSFDIASSVAIQSDGKILVAGKTLAGVYYDFALVRLNSNGTFDNTFGTMGKASFDVNGNSDETRKMVIQPDGKIVVTGYSNTASGGDMATIRCNVNGTLDNTFGTNGIVTTTFTQGAVQGVSPLVLPDGKILVAGNIFINGITSIAAARFTVSGILDTSFGTGGKLVVSSSLGSITANSAKALSSGKIVMGGSLDGDFCLTRISADGIVDSSFGINGNVLTNMGGMDGINTIYITNNDDIIAGGSSVANAGAFAIAKYNQNGILVSTFGIGGKVITPLGTQQDNLYDLILSDSNIIAAGNSTAQAAIVKYRNTITPINNSVVDFDAQNNVALFPNPAQQFVIIYNTDSEIILLQVLDAAGREIKTIQHINAKQVNVNIETLTNGVYIIKSVGLDGLTNYKKFVKE